MSYKPRIDRRIPGRRDAPPWRSIHSPNSSSLIARKPAGSVTRLSAIDSAHGRGDQREQQPRAAVAGPGLVVERLTHRDQRLVEEPAALASCGPLVSASATSAASAARCTASIHRLRWCGRRTGDGQMQARSTSGRDSDSAKANNSRSARSMNDTTVISRPVAPGSPGSSSLRVNVPSQISQSPPNRSASPEFVGGDHRLVPGLDRCAPDRCAGRSNSA